LEQCQNFESEKGFLGARKRKYLFFG